MEINIVMLNGVTVNPQDTVSSLKTLIQNKLGVPVQNQKLFVNGQNTPLNDDSKPLSWYGLQSGSQVSLLITQPPPFQVFLTNLQGKKSTYDITPEETVDHFMARVEQREGVPVSQQRLIYQGREMMTGRLTDYNVTNHSTINLMLRLRIGMDITVTMLGGASHHLRQYPQDTVSSLKRLIQSKLGVPVQEQKLVFMNGEKKTLNDDSKPLSWYGLQSGSQVSLLVTQPPPFPVFLRNHKGKSTTYDITPEETVDHFKARVEQREGVPVSQQRLLHESREMMTGRLMDYHVTKHSTIHLILRLMG